MDEKVSAIQSYEKILTLTQEMLGAARKGEWDNLIVIEKVRSSEFNQLVLIDHNFLSDTVGREHKRSLILSIMQCDEEIKLLSQDWMRELREVLVSIKSEQKLRNTYESESGD